MSVPIAPMNGRWRTLRLLSALTVSVLLWASCAPTGTGAAQRPQRPSIVLITVDTLRSDRLPDYGFHGVETPAFSTLRRDALLFSRVYSPVPLTLPSHVSMLTGLLPTEHGVRDNLGYRFEAQGKPYLPRELKRLGMATAAAVSTALLDRELGLGEGFDVYDDERPRPSGVELGGATRGGRETIQAILPWLAQRWGGPFFLWVHLYEPHTPYEPPEPFRSRYGATYEGEIAAADDAVGLLLGELHRLGLYHEALIVLTSDHGEGLGDHGEQEHGLLLYREALQVPLLLKLPRGERAGATVEAPHGLVDLYSTLLDFAGASASSPATGLLGEPSAGLYAETWYPRLHFGWSPLSSWIEGDRHLVVGGGRAELYDLGEDPGELEDRSALERSTLRALAARLKKRSLQASAPTTPSREEGAALAALGYVGSVAGLDDGGPLPHPRDRLPSLESLRAAFRFYRDGQLEPAVAAFEDVLEREPRLLDAREFLGYSLQRLGRHEAAAEALEQALRLSAQGPPTGPHLALAAAESRMALGQAPLALALLLEAERRLPGQAALGSARVRCLLALGELTEALAAAKANGAAHPESAETQAALGAAHAASGDFGHAEQALEAALLLDPHHPLALNDLAVVWAARGETDAARRLLERAAAVLPLAKKNLDREPNTLR